MEQNVGADDPGSRAVVSTRAVEAVVAALLFVFGAVFAWTSYKLGFRWAIEGPQSGFFPFYVSLLICGASATILFHALRGRDPKGAAPFVERAQLRQVLHVLIPAVFFVFAIKLIGIYVASVIYIAVFMRWLGKYSLVKSVLLSVAIIVAFYFMFEVWFQVPLYKGLWDLTSWTGY
ncbi:MAG: tripartite tricarboxylate transporter TctB family protein [Betaproteobacteria bacterium]|nr:tripartite tricarboxylate transporter TctB family protein [Betaproteobacteria bacterium]